MNRIEICMNCKNRMLVDRVGVTAIECVDPELTSPYKVWQCDTVRCPVCQTTVATRFADKPTENWSDDFDKTVAEAEANPATIRFY